MTVVVQESTLVADAGGKGETGAMVGAFLPDYIAENLTVNGGEPANELHITFAYLGKANELTPEQVSAAQGVVQALATATSAPAATVNRISHFGPNGAGQMAVVYEVDSDELQALRAALVSALEEAGVPFSTKFPVYRPHVTIGYWPADEVPEEFTEGPLDEPIDVSPEALSTAVAGERHAFPFADDADTAELSADPNPNTPHARGAANAGFPHGPSIKWSHMYEGLRRHGFDKSKAAAISNAAFNKYRRFGRPGAPGQKSAAAHQSFLKARRDERRAMVAAVQVLEFRDVSDEPRGAHGRWAVGDRVEGGGTVVRVDRHHPHSVPTAVHVRWDSKTSGSETSHRPDQLQHEHLDVRKLLSDVEPGGGKSISLQTGTEPLEGYAVSRPGSLSIGEERAFEGNRLSEHALNHIENFVGTHPELHDEEGTVLGVFHDTENKTVDVDVTDIVPKERKEDAIALGLRRNQKSIYSLHDEELVPTGGNGDVAVAAAAHDVSTEARDAKGEWTKGAAPKVHRMKELEETHGEWDGNPNNGGRDEDASADTSLVRSFRGRPVPVRGDTVDIYRDLSKEGLGKSGFPDHTAFSMIRAREKSNSRDTLVAAHTRGIHIHNVRSSWNISGKRTAELHDARGVHAFTRGQVHRYVDPAEAQAEVDAPGSEWQKVTYYPGSQFFFRATDRKHFHSAKEAYLVNGELYVRHGKFTDEEAPVGKIERAVLERMHKPVAASAVLDGYDVWESGEADLLQLVQFHTGTTHDVTKELRDYHGRWSVTGEKAPEHGEAHPFGHPDEGAAVEYMLTNAHENGYTHLWPNLTLPRWEDFTPSEQQKYVDTFKSKYGLDDAEVERQTGGQFHNIEEWFAHNLDADEMESTDEDGDWYRRENRWGQALADETGLPLERVFGAVASMSGTRKWEGNESANKEATKRLIMALYKDEPIEVTQQQADDYNHRNTKTKQRSALATGYTPLEPGTYRPSQLTTHQLAALNPWKVTCMTGAPPIHKAIAIIRGEVDVNDALPGPKHRCFVTNLSHPDQKTVCTNDVWHYRSLMGDLKFLHTDNSRDQDGNLVHPDPDKPTQGAVRRMTMDEFEGLVVGWKPDADGKLQPSRTNKTQDIFQSGMSDKKRGISAGIGFYPWITHVTEQAAERASERRGKVVVASDLQARVWMHHRRMAQAGGRKVEENGDE